jgi:hypothetical protein
MLPRLTTVTVPAAHDGPTTASYLAVLRETLTTPAGAFLFDATNDDLVARRAKIVVAHIADAPGRVCAGFNYVVHGSGYYFGGVVTATPYRKQGIMGRLMVGTMLDLASAAPGPVVFELDVRVIDQVPNPSGFICFSHVGFLPTEPYRKVEIAGSALDRHLLATAERDGAFFYVQKMRATERTLLWARERYGKPGAET